MVMVLVVALGRAFSFFGKVQKQDQKLAQGESAYWAMMESINGATAAEEKLGGGAEPHFEQGLEFQRCGFSYDTQHPVFKGLNLDIKAGALTTLVGPSGSGKTTIIDLSHWPAATRGRRSIAGWRSPAGNRHQAMAQHDRLRTPGHTAAARQHSAQRHPGRSRVDGRRR